MSGQSTCALAGAMWAEASKISWHCPQRTQPAEMRSWSVTTLKRVPQKGQRVIWLISGPF
jgi:hypothetical protein